MNPHHLGQALNHFKLLIVCNLVQVWLAKTKIVQIWAKQQKILILVVIHGHGFGTLVDIRGNLNI